MCTRTLTVDRFLAAVLCAFVLVNGCMAVGDNNTDTDVGVGDGSGEKEESTSLDEGLESLYDMTSNFLDVIQPKSKGFILEIMGIDDLSSDGHEDDLKNSLEDDRDEWLDHYVGYVICLVVGAIYVVVIPIIGICFGLCRCCGNCGAHQGAVKRQDKCKRIGCGIGLGILNTVILAGVVCAFMTNEMIRQQTSKDSDAFIPSIARNLDKMKDFKDTAIATYKSIDAGMTHRIRVAVQEAYEIPETTKDLIGKDTNSAAVLDQAEALANSVDAINKSLSYVYEYTESLKDDGETLTDDLEALKTTIQATLATCATQECSDLVVDVDSLDAVADYSNLQREVDNIELQLLKVREVIDGDLKGAIQQGRDEYDSITDDIEDDIELTLQGQDDLLCAYPVTPTTVKYLVIGPVNREFR